MIGRLLLVLHIVSNSACLPPPCAVVANVGGFVGDTSDDEDQNGNPIPLPGFVVEHSPQRLVVELDDGRRLEATLPTPPDGVELGEASGTRIEVASWRLQGDAGRFLNASISTDDGRRFFRAFADQLAFPIEASDEPACSLPGGSRAQPGSYAITTDDDVIRLSAGEQGIVHQDGTPLLAQIVSASIPEAGGLQGFGQGFLRRLLMD